MRSSLVAWLFTSAILTYRDCGVAALETEADELAIKKADLDAKWGFDVRSRLSFSVPSSLIFPFHNFSPYDFSRWGLKPCVFWRWLDAFGEMERGGMVGGFVKGNANHAGGVSGVSRGSRRLPICRMWNVWRTRMWNSILGLLECRLTRLSAIVLVSFNFLLIPIVELKYRIFSELCYGREQDYLPLTRSLSISLITLDQRLGHNRGFLVTRASDAAVSAIVKKMIMLRLSVHTVQIA